MTETKSTPEPIRQWDSLDVHRSLSYELSTFAYQYYGGAMEFASLPHSERLRIVRAFESSMVYMRKVLVDDAAADRMTKGRRK